MTMLRQGDVLLVRIDDFPAVMDEVAPEMRGSRAEHVLAHGEATGHTCEPNPMSESRLNHAPAPKMTLIAMCGLRLQSAEDALPLSAVHRDEILKRRE